jgi:hypothetical protein
MHCDCQTVIATTKNKFLNSKNWHIRLRHDVIKQLLKGEIISIDYVKSEMNLVDSLTKLVGRKMILKISREIWLMLIKKSKWW